MTLFLCFTTQAGAAPKPADLLPDQIGTFKATGSAIPMFSSQSPHLFGEGAVIRTYSSDDGSRYEIEIGISQSEPEAFALLSHARWFFNNFGSDSGLRMTFDDVGTASFQRGAGIFFFKGTTFVSVSATYEKPGGKVKELAQELARGLDAGEGDVPVLVKHLPDSQTAIPQAIYCVNLAELHEVVRIPGERVAGPEIEKKVNEPLTPGWQPVLTVLSFEGGTEAVVANYDQAQLAIVEFTTPQMSIENDSRIWTKIAELKSQGQPTPRAYRRVGNYSVFVFNATDEKSANALIDQVKYEQVVQWLGDDPHLAERLQRYFTQTSAGLLVAVLKSSGLSLVLCLGIGGLVGALLFRHRRAQRAAAFSDAGGSIRLNLDELTGPANTRRLLSTPQESRDDRSS